MKPTIILVHGAFAESASWDNVIDSLAGAGHTVIAAANPLRALTEPSGPTPLWREVPSWFVIGDEDRTIPAALQRFMAERAGARRALAIPGGSHAAVVSHPEETAKMILEAAAESASAWSTDGTDR